MDKVEEKYTLGRDYEAGRMAFEEKRYDDAVKLLEKVVGSAGEGEGGGGGGGGGGYADALNMLGLCYYQLGRRERAVDAFKKALSINPTYTEAAMNLAVLYNEMGMLDRARIVYARAKEGGKESRSYLDPYVKGKLANMHAALGSIYKELGLNTEAASEYKKALSLRPEFFDIKTRLGVIYRDMQKYTDSVKELDGALRLKPDYTAARVQLGLTYYTMGKHIHARAEWQRVLDKNPEEKMAKMYMQFLIEAVKG
ncbi:MAG TPA: tetratricopeptide repeat protein [Thermodesulfobacteriota bacterium]|nr:tetratricopeptide repeat protein [Thermodesulfobacteriota bacterium]